MAVILFYGGNANIYTKNKLKSNLLGIYIFLSDKFKIVFFLTSQKRESNFIPFLAHELARQISKGLIIQVAEERLWADRLGHTHAGSVWTTTSGEVIPGYLEERQCPFCSYRSGNSSHVRMFKHTRERPFSCAKRFALKETHLPIHAKEKPYECSFCLKRVNHVGNLSKHILAKHPQ